MTMPLLLAASLLAAQPMDESGSAATATDGAAAEQATFDLPDWVSASCTASDTGGNCSVVRKPVIFGREPIRDIWDGVVVGGAIASTGGMGGGSEPRWANRAQPKRPACERLGIGGVKHTALRLVVDVFRANTIGYQLEEATTLLSIYGQRAGNSKIFYVVRIDLESFDVTRTANRIACAIDVDSYRTWRNPDNSRVVERDAVANSVYDTLMTRLDATD